MPMASPNRISPAGNWLGWQCPTKSKRKWACSSSRSPRAVSPQPARSVAAAGPRSEPADRNPGSDPGQPPRACAGAWSVDQTGDGDTALTQAASGSRSGLSVGVDVDEFEQDPDTPERIRVTAATLAETSLVAMAAYLGASVDQIAAEKPRGKEPAVTDQPTPTDAGDQPEPAPPRPALILADRDPAPKCGSVSISRP